MISKPSLVSRALIGGLLIGLSGCVARYLVPTPSLYVDTDDNPFASVPEVYRSSSLVMNLRQTEELGRFPATPLPLVASDQGPVDDPEALARWDRVAQSLHAELSRRLALTPRQEAFVVIHGFNYTFEKALRELVLEAGMENSPRFKIHNLVLAAPDLDLGVASQRLAAERLSRAVGRMTIYVSPDDFVLGSSAWLFASDRVGGIAPEDLPPAIQAILAFHPTVSFINVEAVVGDFLHGYYYDHPWVTSDLILMLLEDRDPGAQNGRPLIRRGSNFWEIPDGYPHPQP